MSGFLDSDTDYLDEQDADDDTMQDGQEIDQLHSDTDKDHLRDEAALIPLLVPTAEHNGELSDVDSSSQSANHLNVRQAKAIKDEIVASAADYMPRPNRWNGAPSTWLSWTEEERLIAHSLDRAQSQDLALHLYNAHVLNTNADRTKEERREQIKGKGALRPGDGHTEESSGLLIPPFSWTAWPMPPSTVPREALLPEIGRDHVYRIHGDKKPSANLEACIIATTTRIARKRWKARASPPAILKRDWATKTEGDEDDETSMATPASPVDQQDGDDSGIETDTREVSDLDHESNSASDIGGGEVFMNQAYNFGAEDEIKGASKMHNQKANDQESVPVPMAEDDEARELLLPGARQILSKLDDLLMGLHKARQAYAAITPGQKRGKSALRTTQDASDAESNLSTSTAARRKRRKRRERSSSVASAVSTASASTADEDGDIRVVKKRKLRPRDWSDVLGMAALTGWDSAVIERASKRCADLFGENMLFRTFHESDKSREPHSHYTDFDAAGRGDTPELKSGEEQGLKMIRTSEACGECRRAQRRCEPEEGVEGHGPCKRCKLVLLICSGIRAKVYHESGGSCPYSDCHRHKQPFSRADKLQRHIDAVHEHDLPPSFTSSAVVTSTETGVSSIELTCPIQGCLRQTYSFARGTKLYEHVRKMHPEVDVEEFKRLESTRRGEKRGRYRDEGRRAEVGRSNRSRSKSVVAPANRDVEDDVMEVNRD